MTPAIEICNVTKLYGNTTALDTISLSVDKGELYGIIGPDGSGKSTLFSILSTLSFPDSGTVSELGLDTTKNFRRLRPRIGYMPERFSLYQDLSVNENLNFFASLFGVTINENYDLIAPIFGQLNKFPDRKAGALSGGMKQKLALCCALIHRPEILLLDEPTTGVDAVSRSEFWDMLGDLRKEGITILVSTSYMDEATRCGRISMINHGRILRTGYPAELVSDIGENLYNAVAQDMFLLLNTLRKLPEVTDCYTFGATLHLVGSPHFDPKKAILVLEAEGLKEVRIYPAAGNIEDLFIKLDRDEQH